uniref:Uncharacterized protein n=1 Tax=viral metagenome TaxID=1070528 RepID=A0A6C0CQ18_9ZZZZ
MINAFANHFDEARNCYRAAIAEKKMAANVCSEVIDDIIDKIDADTKVAELSPPLFASRPMTIGGSSIFRDPNYDHYGNPITARNTDLIEEEIRLLKPPKGLKRHFAEVLYDQQDAQEEKEKKSLCQCVLM